MMTQLESKIENCSKAGCNVRLCRGEGIQIMQQNKDDPINCDMEAIEADVVYASNVTYFRAM